MSVIAKYPLEAHVPLVIFLYKPPTGVVKLVVDVDVRTVAVVVALEVDVVLVVLPCGHTFGPECTVEELDCLTAFVAWIWQPPSSHQEKNPHPNVFAQRV
jgi:hypothetical protein